jgi:hypothetical protein
LRDRLRQAEAAQGLKQHRSLRLEGQVEADATLLRTGWVSNNSLLWPAELQEARANFVKANERRGKKLGANRRPKPVPKAWRLHVRVLGLTERAQGQVLVKLLPCKLLPPGGPPAPEGTEEVLCSGLLARCKPGTVVHSDGAHAWPAAVKKVNSFHKLKLRHFQVCHARKQYSKKVVGPRGKQLLAGTQALDSRWRHLKAAMSNSLNAKTRGALNEQLQESVLAWQWRCNLRAQQKPLFEALAKAFQ